MSEPATPTPTAPPPPEESRTVRVATNSFWLGLDSLLGLAGGFGASILVARHFGPQLVGYYAFVMWVVLVTSTATGRGGLVVALRKFLAERLAMKDYLGAKLVLQRYSRLLLLITLGCVSVAAVVMYFTIEPDFYLPAALALASLFPTVYIAVATGANSAIEDFTSIVRASVACNIVNLAGIFLTLALDGELAGLTAALLASRITDYAVRDYYRHRNYAPIFAKITGTGHLDPEIDARMRSEAVKFFAQAAVLEILTLVVWDRSELFFLKYFGPVEQLAFYSLPFSITAQVDAIPRVLFLASSTQVIRLNATNPVQARSMVGALMRLNGLVAVPLSLGIAAMADPLIRVFYGAKYVAAIPVLAILAAFGLVRPFLLPLRSYLVAISRQDLMVKAMLVSAVVDLGLMFLFIRKYGAMGAAWCNGIAQLVGVSIGWLLCSRLASIPVDWGRLARIVLSSAVMAVGVHFACRPLTAVASLIVGPVVGAVLQVLLLRLTRAIADEDRDRLFSIGQKLPGPARRIYRLGVQFAAGV